MLLLHMAQRQRPTYRCLFMRTASTDVGYDSSLMTRLAVVLYTVSLRGVSAGCSPEGRAAPQRQWVRAPVGSSEVTIAMAGEGDGNCWGSSVGGMDRVSGRRPACCATSASHQRGRRHPGSRQQAVLLSNAKGDLPC